MTATRLLEHLLLGLLAGVAIFALAAHAFLALHVAVHAPLLVGSLLGGLLIPWRVAPLPPAPPAPRWLAITIALLLASALVAVTHGAVSTPSRHWDGAVAWDTTASFLAADLSLEQPYFRDPAVFAHSRDYPLLQPLLVATGQRLLGDNYGRLLFPLLFVLTAGLVGTTLRRALANATLAWLATGAMMLTPMLVSPTSGGIDSGYGEAFLLLCTTAMAAGLLQQDARLLFLGAVLAVLVKPEGVVYAGALTAVAFCTAERRLLHAAAAGWLAGVVAWLPLQRGLLSAGAESHVGSFVAAAAGLWLLLTIGDELARRLAWQWRGRAVGAVLLLLVLLLVLPYAAADLGGAGGAMQSYLATPERLWARLDRLPAIAAGALYYALFRGGFGLAFWLPLLGLPGAWSLRSLGPLALFVGAGLGIVMLKFLLAPEPDLQHDLRSSMPRLLLHWLGPVVLLGTARLGALHGAGSAQAEPHRETAAEAER